MAYHSKYSGAEVDSLLDKIKADDVGSIDSSLSTTSANPVQNKVITEELNKKANKTDIATINGQPLTNGGNIEVVTGSYDDTEIKGKLTELQTKVGEFKVKDASVSGNTLNITKEDGTILPFTPQGEDNTLRRDLGKYTSNEQYAAISVAQSDKAINANGEIINKSGYGISNEIAVTKGSIYLFKSNSDIVDVALFTQKIVADIVYSTIEETITTAEGENVTRLKSKTTAKGGDLKSHTYEFVYNTGNETAVWDDIKDNGVAKGASFVIPTQYTEYIPMFSANGMAARPISGHYCLASSVSGIMVISAKSEDLTGYLIEVRYGVVASIVNNLARKADVEVVSGLYKKGVISHTLTWASDYSSYTITNQVIGVIPQAIIDQWLSLTVGETRGVYPDFDHYYPKFSFNEETGYFEIDEIVDLTYKDVLTIIGCNPCKNLVNSGGYNFAVGIYASGINGNYTANVNTGISTGSSLRFAIFGGFPRYSRVIMWKQDPYETPGRCERLQVVKYINLDRRSSLDCTKAYALREFFAINLGFNISFADSAWLRNDSIKYMIDRAKSVTFTITLHPAVYSRAMADEGIQASLAAHTNVTLASA